MVKRCARRTRWFGIALSVVAAGACDTQDGEARLVDRACRSGRCTVTGSAKQVSGITSDSVGFRLGPGPGKVRIPLPAFSSAGNDSFHVDVLASGTGQLKTRLSQESCDGSGNCNLDEVDSASGILGADYEWISAGTFVGKSPSGFAGFVLEAELDTSGDAEIADVRYDRFDAIHCGVSAVGARP